MKKSLLTALILALSAPAFAQTRSCTSVDAPDQGLVLQLQETDSIMGTIMPNGFPYNMDVSFDYLIPGLFEAHNCAAINGTEPLVNFDIAGTLTQYKITMACDFLVEDPAHPGSMGWAKQVATTVDLNLNFADSSQTGQIKITAGGGQSLADLKVHCK